jgi:hypothetical protein
MVHLFTGEQVRGSLVSIVSGLVSGASYMDPPLLGWCPVQRQHFHRHLQCGGIPGEPFLNVEGADDGGLALGLDLGELDGVLGVLLFLSN